VTDLAGNTSAPSQVVDPPIALAAPAIASFSPHSGSVASVTDASSLTLTGTAEANTNVSIYDGSTVLGTVAANGGTWSFVTPKLADGTHAFTTTDTNSAGLTSAPSSPFNVTVDTVAPTDTFTGATPNSTLSNSFKLTGTTLDNGVAESGDVVKVYDGSTLLGSTTVGSNGTWNFTTAALSNTVHTFTSTVTDIAGNIGQSTGAVIYGTSSDQTLVSTTGNDIMTGAAGADTFVFNGTNFGKDVITDFKTQGANHDVLQFSQSAFQTVADVLHHAQQVGSNVVVTYNAVDTVTLQNVSLNKLTQNDIHLA
jgi:Ca2+-binding RTX toxin-like protein